MAGRLASLLLLLAVVLTAGCSGESAEQKGVIAEQPSGAESMKDRGMSKEEMDSRAQAPR